MAFAKGAYSRHVLRRLKKVDRKKVFGSRHQYRKSKHSMGGKGASYG